ncbi:rCG61970 [Rattus norvegicus]|uniref:RCG61970 n=1 Tax=Rattus norvegicus TaxID=10116 RepID=A6HBQ3_RAT|nr:rCG61970 [Rattus norvegicus]
MKEEEFRPGSSMPSAAPDPGPLLQTPSPQPPGLELGEEVGEGAVPLGNIPAEVGRCGRRLGRSPCALAACALPRLKAPSSQLTGAWRLPAARSSCGERGSN